MVGTVLIVGASRGIGLELVRQYAEMGHRVIAGCRNPASAGVFKSNRNIVVQCLDTSSDESVASFATTVGDQPIDIAIVSAGVAGGERDQQTDVVCGGDHTRAADPRLPDPHDRLRCPVCAGDRFATGDRP